LDKKPSKNSEDKQFSVENSIWWKDFAAQDSDEQYALMRESFEKDFRASKIANYIAITGQSTPEDLRRVRVVLLQRYAKLSDLFLYFSASQV
jgi:predicted DNA-binding protein YlxM (UPF0122 family)